MDQEKRLIDIYSRVLQSYAAVYLIHKEDKTYEALQTDDVFMRLISETGSLGMLYSQLFSLNKSNMSRNKKAYC